jgi:hypothetical protein
VRDLPLSGGGTFGSRATRVIRIDIDGTGPIPEREVTLETRPAVTLFQPPRRDRAEQVLRGLQRILEERGGLVRGLTLAETDGDAQAAAIATVVRHRHIDHAVTAGDRAEVTRMLRELGADQADHAFAWYHPRFQEVVLGPEISRGLLTHVRTPGRATKEQNLFAAYVLLHELEHTITPTGGEDYERLQWLEEGTADTLARWPGAAAATAKELGMPYPRGAETREFRTDRGGYPEWTDAVRVLIGAAGIDWRDPRSRDAAAELLQGDDVAAVPAVLAARIATRNRLSGRERRVLERGIRALDGDVRAARRLVARP